MQSAGGGAVSEADGYGDGVWRPTMHPARSVRCCRPGLVDQSCPTRMLACMRTTLYIDDNLMTAALRAAGVDSKTRVVELALEMLIQSAARHRIAALHGAIPKVKASPRRRARR